jgi:hypothetical protein
VKPNVLEISNKETKKKKNSKPTEEIYTTTKTMSQKYNIINKMKNNITMQWQ